MAPKIPSTVPGPLDRVASVSFSPEIEDTPTQEISNFDFESGEFESSEDYERAEALESAAAPPEREFQQIRTGDRQELQRIASQVSMARGLTRTDSRGLTRKDTYADVGLDDPALNPASREFDAYKFARVMMRLATEKGIAQRKAGFVFRNLRVTGTGNSLQYQHTVSSVLTMPLRLGELFQTGKEKVILNQFDGVVKAGELLVVLGRPGSGCSTFLKAIAGETHGLKIDPKAVIHYDGMMPLLSAGS